MRQFSFSWMLLAQRLLLSGCQTSHHCRQIQKTIRPLDRQRIRPRRLPFHLKWTEGDPCNPSLVSVTLFTQEQPWRKQPCAHHHLYAYPCCYPYRFTSKFVISTPNDFLIFFATEAYALAILSLEADDSPLAVTLKSWLIDPCRRPSAPGGDET